MPKILWRGRLVTLLATITALLDFVVGDFVCI